MVMVKRKSNEDEALVSAIRNVPLGKMCIAANAQRVLRPARVNKLVSEMNLDDLGLPVLSDRDGKYYIVDGQHRIEALKKWLGVGWEPQQLQCKVYSGLTEQQEADLFDRLNDTLAVNAFDKFRVRVAAGRPVENAIKNIVEAEGLKIAPSKKTTQGAVSCVGTLRKIYMRSDGQVLRKTLVLIRDSFGDAAMESVVIDGVSLLVQRYAKLDEYRAIRAFKGVRGGHTGLLGLALVLQKQTGNDRASCVAAAAVDIINKLRGGGKLPSWWRTKQAAAPHVPQSSSDTTVQLQETTH